jgi:cytochrome c553
MAVSLVPCRPIATAQDTLGGEQIYRAKCARCHGARGEGTEEHTERLEGDRSVAQLAEFIGETMPEDDPGSLSADEAKAVAAFVHDSFYSAVARERNRPARIELTRLTVGQYRQAVLDLIGSFRQPAKWGDARGLSAQYYSGRRMRRGRPVATRIDAEIDFDFGTEAPVPEISEPHEFSIRWEGSLLAPEIGEYDFVVRTEHAARLWINDMERPLIDAWVKSGNDTEYKASLYLVGGRVYPLRLEFTKAKQGVDDSKKQETTPPSAQASIALLWKHPQGALQPIPGWHLSPEQAPEAYVATTPFPPDDRSYGWERGTSISKGWDQATTDAALAAAGYVRERLDELAGNSDDDTNRLEHLRSFARTFAERAMRRPLGDGEIDRFICRQFDAGSDPEMAVKRVVLLVLKSPRFLFREVGGGPDQFDVAARLSFGLWDSIPDRDLVDAAAAGRLGTKEQVAKQAERMLEDLRARRKLRQFLLTWLNSESGNDLSKDAEQFPDFDTATIADLRTSLELFLDDVLWSDAADYRRLLLADEVFVNDRLAKFYGGCQPSPSADFTKVSLDGGKRAGILTHPYLMARFAHTRESSPIHRGVFLARGVLGQSLRPPPEAVAPLAPDLHPGLTTRERVTLQTQAATCMNCHGIINPLGFTLEHFDAVGRYRELDRGKPIDDSGGYPGRDGKTVTINGARELAEFLAASEEAHTAFTEQLFHHLVQQPVQAYGPRTLDDLVQSFAAHDYNIRKLAVEVMAASALVGHQSEVHADSAAADDPNETNQGGGAAPK